MTESLLAEILRIVDDELGAIYVQQNNMVRWTDVANAQTHIEGRIRALCTHEGRGE